MINPYHLLLEMNHISNKINSNQLLEGMKKSGVLFFEVSPNQYRLVTHYGITKIDIDLFISSHPTPDEISIKSSKAVIAYLSQSKKNF